MGLHDIVLAGAGAVLMAGAALAQGSPFEQRVALMKANGAAMGAIGKYVKGEAEFSPAVEDAAKKLEQNSKEVAGLFPPGSTHEKSRAKPEIWSDADGFQKRLAAFQASAAELAQAVASKDKQKIGDAHAAVGKACGGCHDDFRSPPKS